MKTMGWVVALAALVGCDERANEQNELNEGQRLEGATPGTQPGMNTPGAGGANNTNGMNGTTPGMNNATGPGGAAGADGTITTLTWVTVDRQYQDLERRVGERGTMDATMQQEWAELQQQRQQLSQRADQGADETASDFQQAMRSLQEDLNAFGQRVDADKNEPLDDGM